MVKMQRREVLVVLFVVVLFAVVRKGEAQSQHILINCGTNSSVGVGGRTWTGDSVSTNNLTYSLSGVSASTTALSEDMSSLGPLYGSARIFTSGLNYTFRVVLGNYFLRLHFCPFPVDGHNMNESSFGVFANGLRLLAEFNVPDEISMKNSIIPDSGSSNSSFFLIKEYFLAINSAEFVVEFIPTEKSFGFINAIEMYAVEGKLFEGYITKVGGAGSNLNFSGRGIETMYRLNVGGSEIKPNEDSLFWRTWEEDAGYMINSDAGVEIKNSSNITYSSMNDSYVAPLLVYETARKMSNTQVLEKRFNMSWKFKVDPNFDYLVRLHFCELEFERPNQRNFRIYVNNRTAADNFDIYEKGNGSDKAYHQDYLDAVSSKVDTLWIQLGPATATGASGTDALLNGLEIYKLSRSGNLAFTNRFSSSRNSAGSGKSRILWVGIGAGIASVVVLACIGALVLLLCKKHRGDPVEIKSNGTKWRPLFLHGTIHTNADGKGMTGVKNQNSSIASTRVGKQFTIAEIRAATKNFDESMVIGVGGFGKVYKGEIEDGLLAAIKRANPQSQQGLAEFETEILLLSKLRHRHLVSLIGFCEEQSEMILVYEYMANGTFRSHLFGSDLLPLSWKQRLEICIGAARGLHYLHTGAERPIIHRDVKTTNILLDENYVAKMSDFGLSRTGPSLEHTHVSTAVKGSFGYLDPEYFRRQQLTEKSDVYSFGVVLFEVVCARAVINPSLPKDQINLAEWALRWQRQRSLETIIDPHLKGHYAPESMEKFGEIAEKCLADEGKNRPTMGEVLWHLEYVLHLHQSWLSASSETNLSQKISTEGPKGEVEERQDCPHTAEDSDADNKQNCERNPTERDSDLSNTQA